MTDEERHKELYRINPNARSTDTITIRKCYDKNLTDIELQKEIWKSAKDLLEWAESLECNECYGCGKCEDSDENTA